MITFKKNIGVTILIGLGIFLPIALSSSYSRGILVLFEVYSLLALSMNVLLGNLGLLSFAQGAFFGLGAYSSALLMSHFQFPFWITWILASLLNGIVGGLIGLLSLRLRNVYFAIVTLGFAELIRLTILNWDQLTRGPMGLSVSRLNINLFSADYSLVYFYLLFVVLLCVLYFLNRLLASTSGRNFIAIFENEELGKAVGINPFILKVSGFALSTAIAGLSGACYSNFFEIITPDLAGIEYTTIALLMVIVGGKGTLFGPILGAGIFSFIPEILRFAEGNVRMMIFACLLLLVMIFMPNGLIHVFNKPVKLMKAKLMPKGKQEWEAVYQNSKKGEIHHGTSESGKYL